MIGVAFGRIGCFLNGCCYGAITQSFLGIRFPKASGPYIEHLKDGKIAREEEFSAPVLPTQLMETAATLAFFFVLSWYDRTRKKHSGETALLAGMLYPAWRFIVEFLRDDPRGAPILGLSYSQVVSLLVFLVCGVAFFLLRRREVPLQGTPGDKLPAAQPIES